MSYHQHLNCYKIRAKKFVRVLDKGRTLLVKIRVKYRNRKMGPYSLTKSYRRNSRFLYINRIEVLKIRTKCINAIFKP